MSSAPITLEPRPRGPTPAWWGVIMLCLTEFALFAALVASDFYLRFHAPAWPPKGVNAPDLLVPIINTVLLVLSSASVVWADRAAKNDNRGTATLGLGVAALLGAAYIALQAREWSRAEFTAQQHTYGSLFFTLTGLHGLHVIAGVLLLLTLFAWTLLGRLSRTGRGAISTIGLYWHFVTLMWLIFVFPTVYISPHIK